MEVFDIAVIGGGPAGMAAAGMAAEEGLRVLLIERDEALGGILNQCAHKGFGITYFGEELTGQEYAARCIEAFKKTNAETLTDTMVLGIDENRVITLSGTKTRYDQIRAKAIIIATGCRERPIGALPIVGSRPAGVLSAGAAQKMVNVGGYDIGNNFVILGSGDIGMIVARELALRNKKVIAVIEKEKQCGGLPRNRINCLERFNIPLITETTIKEVHGKARICGVTTISTDGSEKYIECDTLITSVGLIPERDLLDKLTEKELPEWLFICGNADYVHDLVDDVTIESEKMGKIAAAFIKGEVNKDFDTKEADTNIQREEMLDTDDDDTNIRICVACPKSCRARYVDGKWLGLACGRKEPALAI